MHVVAVIAMHGVVPFDLAIPCEVFGRVRAAGGERPYEVLVCGEAGEVEAGDYGLRVRRDLSHVAGAHTVVVPGLADRQRPRFGVQRPVGAVLV